MVGAGAAGCAAALALAPHIKVTLVDRAGEVSDRIGETLPAAAGRILDRLGHRETFAAEGHAHAYARRSVWGHDKPVELDSMTDLDGPGWRLDRKRFEQGLRDAVMARGADLRAPSSVKTIDRVVGSSGWTAQLDNGDTISANILIDAGGRSSRVTRWTGAIRRASDKLACAWQYAPMRTAGSAITYTEACAEGWWYSAPLPDGRRILVFHCDADLPEMGEAARDGFARLLQSCPQLVEEVSDADWNKASQVQMCAAHSTRLDRFAGWDWMAVGDAATAFDPLSSQGLFNALYTGMRAGECAAAMLGFAATARDPAEEYQAELDAIWAGYRNHYDGFYSAEQRWADTPFWSRRVQ